MKTKAFLACFIATFLSFQAQAESWSTPTPAVTDSTVLPASCDLSKPMEFGEPCDASCDSSGSCDGLGCERICNGSKSLLGFGIIKPSEGCYDDFISPMTNPVYFEDPRQLTEVRAIFIHHKLPLLLGLPSDELRVYAVQARLRLTERLSLIAVKDGYIDSSSPIVDSGWADVTAGLKYSLYRDPDSGRLLSAGLRFETTAGRAESLQGNGDGVFDVFLSGGTRIGDRSHFLTSSGFILPVDRQAENQMFYWSSHLDRRIGDRFYAFSELNWFNYLRDASAFPLPLEGGDLFNFGSPGVRGNDIVTNAWGLKMKPNRNIESGVAWEFPLTQRRGVLDNRITADLILRF